MKTRAILGIVSLLVVLSVVSVANADTTTTSTTPTTTTTTTTTTSTSTTTATPPQVEIPGVPYPSSVPAQGTLDAKTAPDSVYSVSMEAGTTYRITLDAPEKSSTGRDEVKFQLRLFDISATKLTDAPLKTAKNKVVNYIEFKATKTGVYYLNAHAESGNGAFKLYFAPLAENQICPGKRLKMGHYYNIELIPSLNQEMLCFSFANGSRKTFVVHLQDAELVGSKTDQDFEEEDNFIGIGLIDPKGTQSECFDKNGDAAEHGCRGVASLTWEKPHLGLYSLKLDSISPFPTKIRFGVMQKYATEVNISEKESPLKKGTRYPVTLKSRLDAIVREFKRRNQKITFVIRKCNVDGTVCKAFSQESARTDRRGRAKRKVRLPAGRYEIKSVFAGTKAALSSESQPKCLAVGPSGNCLKKKKD